MAELKGSFNAQQVIKDPEIIRELRQRSIIIYSRKINNIGVAINLFLERNWTVTECWTDPARNHFVLLESNIRED